MDSDDLEPRRPRPRPLDLDLLGIEELESYLQELEEEAARVREKIAAKSRYRNKLDGLFKT